jgi:hypothetical protein
MELVPVVMDCHETKSADTSSAYSLPGLPDNTTFTPASPVVLVETVKLGA